MLEHAVKLFKCAFLQARRFIWPGFKGFWRAAAEARRLIAGRRMAREGFVELGAEAACA